MSSELDKDLTRKGKHVALVIAGAMILWFVANMVGQAVGLPGRYALLFDMAALAALIYAVVNIFQIWRARRTNQG